MADRNEQPPSDAGRFSSTSVVQQQKPYASQSPYMLERNNDQNNFRNSREQTGLEPQTRQVPLQNPYSQSPRQSHNQVQSPYGHSPRQSQSWSEARYYRNNAVKKRPLAETSPNALHDNSRTPSAYKLTPLSQQACHSLSNNDSGFVDDCLSASGRSTNTGFQTLPIYSSKYAPTTALKLLNSRRQEEEYHSEKVLYLVPPTVQGLHSSSWLKLGLGITELAGEAGSGKSQMAMSLCVQAALKHQLQSTSSIKAIYISLAGGQGASSRVAHRMQQMVESRQEPTHKNYEHHQWRHPPGALQQEQEIPAAPSSYSRSALPPPSSSNIQSVLSQILTRSVRNRDELFTLLREELSQVLQQQQQQASVAMASGSCPPPNQSLQQNSVSVIVLDSIADLFRVGNGEGAFEAEGNLADRASLLFETAALLRRLSDRFRIPIVVINQVSSDFSTNSTIPTLGLSWANCVNASYLLRRTSALAQSAGTARMLFLTKSPCHRVGQKAVFRICRQGISTDEEKTIIERI